ncbi:Kinase [Hexamita inflata]|uniref:Kinase n=1 Tax=Hexamita inflata TaxID=28002 RepID=A0AA86PUF4_9EUKA|nr:Kinase [Hexamita inflata]
MRHSFLLDQNRIDEKDITKLEKIGDGFFSSVYSGVYKNKRQKIPVAIKELNKHMEPQMFEREVNVCQLTHENIVHIFGWTKHEDKPKKVMCVPQTPTKSTPEQISIVMELCQGGSVDSFIAKCQQAGPGIRIRILLQTALGLQHLHSHGIMHRDLKVENIILKDPLSNASSYKDVKAKLTDFGLSRKIDRGIASRYTATVGTPLLIAPECFDSNTYDEGVDIFTFGLVILQVFAQTTDPDEIRTDDFQINPAAITKMDIPEQVKQLIIKCCSNIKNRLKIDEVVGCLQALDKFYNK